MNTGEAPDSPSNGWLRPWPGGPAAGLTYALEGSVFVGGAAVQWLRDGLGLIRTAADIEALARIVPDNGGVYLCRRSPGSALRIGMPTRAE